MWYLSNALSTGVDIQVKDWGRRSFTSLLGSRLRSVISTLAGLLPAKCNFSTNRIPVAFRREQKNHSSVQEILKIYQLEIQKQYSAAAPPGRDEASRGAETSTGEKKQIAFRVHMMSVLINKSQHSKILIIKLLNMINTYQLGDWQFA